MTSEGPKTYPKGTFGVLFGDGDNDPAVPRKDIRVIKLSAGMRIKCLYGGGDTFFPGKISGLNERDGKVLAYRVRYDDGDTETVKRNRIRVDTEEMLEHEERRKRRVAARKAVKQRRKEDRAKARSNVSAHHARREALVEKFGGDAAFHKDVIVAALLPRWRGRPTRTARTSSRWSTSRTRLRRDAAAARARRSSTRVALGTASRALERGGQAVLHQHYHGRDDVERPAFGFEDESAAKRLQST